MSFEVNGYQIVKKCISKETIQMVETELTMLESTNKFLEDGDFSDSQVEKSFAWYGSFTTESLLLLVKPQVEKIVGKELYPSYSYMRIYYNGAIMERHLDRPSCQYSATLNISVDETGPWDIWFQDLNGKELPLSLNPGDMCVYKGTDLDHWRDTYTGNRQIQVFLHYVDVDGIYSDCIYDGRDMLGMPCHIKRQGFIPHEL